MEGRRDQVHAPNKVTKLDPPPPQKCFSCSLPTQTAKRSALPRRHEEHEDARRRHLLVRLQRAAVGGGFVSPVHQVQCSRPGTFGRCQLEDSPWNTRVQPGLDTARSMKQGWIRFRIRNAGNCEQHGDQEQYEKASEDHSSNQRAGAPHTTGTANDQNDSEKQTVRPNHVGESRGS